MKQQLCIRKKGNNLWYIHNIQKLNMIQKYITKLCYKKEKLKGKR